MAGAKGCPSGKCRYDMEGNVFEVDERYECIRLIGKGAFGAVCAARDKVTGADVAIKKIMNATESKVDAQRTVRELRILTNLSHENVISIKDVMRPADKGFQDIYIVTERMDLDLHKALRTLSISGEHVKVLIHQVRQLVMHGLHDACCIRSMSQMGTGSSVQSCFS